MYLFADRYGEGILQSNCGCRRAVRSSTPFFVSASEGTRPSTRPAQMAIFAEPGNEAPGRVCGRAVVTPWAFAAIEKVGHEPEDVLARHVSGD
jgi:hypothetical protein